MCGVGWTRVGVGVDIFTPAHSREKLARVGVDFCSVGHSAWVLCGAAGDSGGHRDSVKHGIGGIVEISVGVHFYFWRPPH